MVFLGFETKPKINMKDYRLNRKRDKKRDQLTVRPMIS